MFSSKCYVLLGLLLLLTLFLDPTSGRKGFGGHSNPKSSGLSGGGHRSGGLSGGGHGYPSSGGGHGYPSSGGGHGYPSSGGGHGYPSSGGLSGGGHTSGGGYPSSGGNRGYPSSGGNRGYPSSGGGHGYPSSGGGLSGNNRAHPAATPVHTTKIVNNYHYSPPQQISYPTRGGISQSYPVYRGQPPTYVYDYKRSDSKYGTLLAGLALMNLGTLGVATYAATRNHNTNYKPQPGEICKFGVKKDNGDYEETKIDCQIISGFIMQAQQTNQQSTTGTNSTITTTTTVTNMTMVNATNGMPQQIMLANGTLVPYNATVVAPNGTVTSSVTVTTTTNTTLVDALNVKGKPVEVTPGMQCFVIRHSPTSDMRKTVPCGLLQTYADKSIRSAASEHAPMFTIVAAIVAYCVAY